MTALVVTLVIGMFLVFLFSVSHELASAQEKRKAQQQLDRALQALAMLTELHVPIAQMVESILEGQDARVLPLAWEVLQRRKAACEFARGNRV